MARVDLNCDLGESFGTYKLGFDGLIMPLITSANIACGFHAGDPAVMAHTVEQAALNGVSIGAHPGYPDLQGFGRRNMNVSAKELKAMVQYQIGALNAFAVANGVHLQHVKPHGAMYNMAAKDRALAAAIAEGIVEVDNGLILLGLSGSLMLEEGKKAGLKTASEVFADRAYEEDGSLRARTKPGSMITDTEEALARVKRMVTDGCVRTYAGKEIPIQADSICVHGDGEKALEFTGRIREMLESAGVEIVPLSEIVQ